MRSFPSALYQVPVHDTDCSELASIIAQAAGAPTPYVVDREGNTTTMLDKLPHIRKRHSRAGDFVVFSETTEHPAHVVVLRQGGRWHSDPIVFSHGEPGVHVWPLSQEVRYHAGQPVHFLRSVPANI